MRLIFMGTPALAIPSLEALQHDHEILLVVTQPDKLAGRGHKLVAPPVKEYAQQHGLPVAQPEKARDPAFVRQLQVLRPDAMAVVAYGQILPRGILELPRENFPGGGCVNLHFSLLPHWRGAAPVQYSLWKGDAATGVSTQWMAEKLDAGDLILQQEVAIGEEETSGELFERLTPLGAEVLRATLRLVVIGEAPHVPQEEALATFAPTIKKEEVQIHWNQSAREIFNQIRAFNPRPTAQCAWKGEPLKIHRARVAGQTVESTPATAGTLLETKERVLVATGAGALELLEVQPPGKPKMNAPDWARGARISAGDSLE
jgi:methionyl-tRNA formyltransferase